MKLLPGRRRRPTQIEPFSQSSEGSPAGALKWMAFAHERLQAVRDQRAHRAAFLGSNHLRFAEKVRIELERNVRFHSDPSTVPDIQNVPILYHVALPFQPPMPGFLRFGE